MPLSRASTRRRYNSILGITSWYSEPSPTQKPPLIDRIVDGRVQAHTENILSPILYRRVGFLCFSSLFFLVRTPDDYSCLFYFQKLHQFFFRISRVLFGLFRCLCDENIVLDASCHQGLWQCPGELSSEVLSSQIHRGSTRILKTADIENSPMRLVAR